MKPNPLSADLYHILDHTRDLWEDLRGARLFITGGTGFFGCWLLESFLFANEMLDLKASATVLTRRPDSVKNTLPHLMLDPAVTLIKGDVRNFEFPKGEYSHVIHAATETTLVDPLDKFISNIEGTRRVLDFALASGAGKFLFTSSGAVYGKQPSDMTHIPESYLGAPEPSDLTTAYGQSKRASEFLCTTYANKYGFQATIARCFAFVGPRLPLDSNYAIGNFIQDAMMGVPIKISGDGTAYRSHLYAADLAIWLWTILLRGKSCHPYNVGSENDLSIEDLAMVVASSIAPGLSIQIAQQHISGESIKRYVPMLQRAKIELGLQEFIKLSDSIQRTAKWCAL
ncbi:MAG: NAD-dependent epimerase/dehydratase family protein [Chloroflexi bacterium]|nr:NAD-dependent epimerase/dehydratase family protein [Chloroflexota bacterium]